MWVLCTPFKKSPKKEYLSRQLFAEIWYQIFRWDIFTLMALKSVNLWYIHAWFWIERLFAKYFARNYEKKLICYILGISDAWSTIHLSHHPSEPAYYIRDWRILDFFIKKCALLCLIKVSDVNKAHLIMQVCWHFLATKNSCTKGPPL